MAYRLDMDIIRMNAWSRDENLRYLLIITRKSNKWAEKGWNDDNNEVE